MRSKFFVHLRRQWMGAVALFLVLAGGTAYAANSVFSEDIVDGEVKSVDIGNNQVRSADVRDDSLAGGGLTGDDIQEATLNTVQGRRTYSNRMMVAQGDSFKCCLLVTSGLGQIEAGCFSGADFINYRNTTRSTVEVWSDRVLVAVPSGGASTSGSGPSAAVPRPGQLGRKRSCRRLRYVRRRNAFGRDRQRLQPEKDGDLSWLCRPAPGGWAVPLSGPGDAVD